MELTVQERRIIDMLREARPHETLLIVKDQLGRPNHFLITRTQKIIIGETRIEAMST